MLLLANGDSVSQSVNVEAMFGSGELSEVRASLSFAYMDCNDLMRDQQARSGNIALSNIRFERK